MRRAWACDGGETYILYRNSPLQVEIPHCPAKLVGSNERLGILLYHHWTEGRFPVGGGVLDQSVAALEAFDILDTAMAIANKAGD